jgi:pimeloyl-ACP methyl ester carboxylesterase
MPMPRLLLASRGSTSSWGVTTYVLVHGGWGGGWQWGPVAERLRAAGHGVTTPTLTGMGERSHVPVDGEITLETHIQDLIEHLFFEDLREVVLVGWSYGAAPVEGVADRVPERVRTVVDLDGFVVDEGEHFLDLNEWEADEVDDARATGWVPAPVADDFMGVLEDADLREFVGARERPHPAATLMSPYPDLGGARRRVRHVFVTCTEMLGGEEKTAKDLADLERVRTDPMWELVELAVSHLGVLYAPDLVAHVLLEVADQSPSP